MKPRKMQPGIGWAIAHKETGEMMYVYSTRNEARQNMLADERVVRVWVTEAP